MRIQPTRSRYRQAPRTRALLKIIVLVVLVNQILTASFAFLAHENHPDIALGLTTLFSFLLCAILSAWIRSDAKHAWLHARDAGLLSSALIRGGRTVWIRHDCPRRWLVVLHIELEGGLAASETEPARAAQPGRET